MTVRVLLVDDHPVVRSGLRAVLDLDAGVQVIGDTGDVEAAVEQAARADVVLMDLQFGAEVRGVEATRRIVDSWPQVRVVVLTTYDAEADVVAALDAGACGYLLKSAGPAELIDAVTRAASGQTVLAPEVAARLVHRVRTPHVALTPRELQVLGLVQDGLSNAQIAASLFLSQATVKTHLVHLFAKLEVDSRTAAVARATDWGLLRR